MNGRPTLIERITYRTEHGDKEASSHAFPRSASVRIEITLPQDRHADTVVLRIHRDADGHMFLFPMERRSGSVPERFSARVECADLCGDAPDGLFCYCCDVYHPEGCVSYGGENTGVLVPCGEDGKRQFLVWQEPYETPSWLRGGIIYHVFVDRFRRSGRAHPKKGAVMHASWDTEDVAYPEYPGAPTENNDFFGGDLYGIAEKLDDIAALGVTCIYLSPVFDAASNHKYDTGDYEHVDPMFGGDDALRALCEAASARGIRILLDGVFNHTGADSRYFNRYGHYPDVGAYQSRHSPYASWFRFTSWPDAYDCWWNVPSLPAVRGDDPSYRAYMLGENGIVARWLRAGAAGFRLDVADELSDGFLEAFRRRVKQISPEIMIYGEVWEDATDKIAYGQRRRYLRGAQLDSVMNYPLRAAILSYVRDGDADAMRRCIDTVYRHCPKPAVDLLMNFLGTHDTMRALTALGGESPVGRSNAELSAVRMSPRERETATARLRLAYAILISMPGVPSIYYGDEAGMEGYGDPFCRRPYPWGREDVSLREYYRSLGQLRRRRPVFRDGSLRLLLCTPELLLLIRENGMDTPLLLAVNRGSTDALIRLSRAVRPEQGGEASSAVRLAPLCACFYIPQSPEISVLRAAMDGVSERTDSTV